MRCYKAAVALLVFCSSCSMLGGRDSTVEAGGTVLNKSTGEPIAGLSVVMKVAGGGGGEFGSWGGSYQIIASDVTDNHGRYFLSADLGDLNMATVYLNTAPYDPTYFPFNYSTIAGEHTDKTIALYQTTTLRARVEISEPLLEGDRYCLDLEFMGVCESDSQTAEVADSRGKGNAYNPIRLGGTIHGEQVVQVDSVYCRIEEPCEYEITY